MNLNLGCGYNKIEGYIGVDIDASVNPDIIADLSQRLPFEDNSIDNIICEQVLEHIHNYPELIKEVHRILKPEGIVKFSVPKFPCIASIADPDHVRFFVSETFMHFCNPKWFNPSNFRYKGLFNWEGSEEKRWKNKDEKDEEAGKYFTELSVTLKKTDKYTNEAITKIFVETR
jgi:ubiquinone/menaquinone biosynthesis C-methylase UbiE